MPKHRAGKKITRRHTTVTEAAGIVVDIANKHLGVTKISLGIIDAKARSKQRRLRFKETRSGWKVDVYGTISRQTLFLQVSLEERQKVKRAIEQEFLP